MSVATVTFKGQITIPKEIREHLRLHTGDKVDFLIEDSGKVILRSATSDVSKLEGILQRPGMKSVSIEEMSRAIKALHKRV
jgi:AbrB family looped-hinge helix DNA binding protein